MCNYLENLISPRKQTLKEMIRNIEINSEYEEGSYTFAIYGEYGSGKTYFLNAFQEILSNNNCQLKEEFELQANFKLIKINAWEEDYLKDPILSIGLKIANEMKDEKDLVDQVINSVVSLSKNFFLNLANENIYIKSILETYKEHNKNIAQSINGYYSSYKEYLKNIKESLTEYIEKLKENQADKTKNTKLLILVDELDRCRPDYAIEFLEAINHIFSVKNLIFVFGIDKNALKSAMTTIYGANMNFDNYMKKFIHSDVSLNKLTDSDNEEIIEHYIKIYYKDKPDIFKEKLIQSLTLVVNHFELNPRNIEYTFRILKLFDEKIDNNSDYFMLLVFTLSCIKSKYHDEYYELFDHKKLDQNILMTDINLGTLSNILDKINIEIPINLNFNIVIYPGYVNLKNLQEVLFIASFKKNIPENIFSYNNDIKNYNIMNFKFNKAKTKIKNIFQRHFDSNKIEYNKFFMNDNIYRWFSSMNKADIALPDKSLMTIIFNVMQ